MSPQLYTQSHRTPPWVHVQQQFDTTPGTIDALRVAAGLTWEPYTEAHPPRFIGMDAQGHPVYDETVADRFKYVLHSGTGHVIESTKSTFHLFTHAQMFNAAEQIVQAAAGKQLPMTWVAGGELNRGGHVWLCAQLGEEIYLPGDQSPYVNHMVFSNRHDGHGALKILPVGFRIACSNAIHAAEMDAHARMAAFTFRHTSPLTRKLDKAVAALAATVENLTEVHDTARQMLAVKIRPELRSEILSEYALRMVINQDNGRGSNREVHLASPHSMKTINATVADLQTILASQTCTGIADTAWGIYQAIVERADHVRSVKETDRWVARTIMDPQPVKALGMQVIRELHRH